MASRHGWPWDTLDSTPRGLAVPAAIAGATIRNKNTRMAYYRAVTDFFA
jgi:hypothetical protein